MSAFPPGFDPYNTPLAPNPNGDAPNFDGGPSLKPHLWGTGIIFIPISVVFVFLRVYTGLKKSRKLFADDWLCVIGLILGIAQWSIQYAIVANGVGKHSWDVRLSDITPLVMQLQISNQIIYGVAHFTIKASIICFFLRLFGTLAWVRHVSYTMLVLIFLTYASFEGVSLPYCVPWKPGEGWDGLLLQKCATIAPATIAVGVVSAVADLVIFVIPFPILAKLNLSRDKKRGMAIVFTVGFLVFVTSVVGLVYRVIVTYGKEDPVWNGGNVAITAYIEVFGTVIVGCAPALSSFWANIFTKTRLYSRMRSSLSRSLFRSTTKQLTAPSVTTGSAHSRQNFGVRSSDQRPPGTTHSDNTCPHCPHCNTTQRGGEAGHQRLGSNDVIQKSTMITMDVSDSSWLGTWGKNGEWELKNTTDKW